MPHVAHLTRRLSSVAHGGRRGEDPSAAEAGHDGRPHASTGRLALRVAVKLAVAAGIVSSIVQFASTPNVTWADLEGHAGVESQQSAVVGTTAGGREVTRSNSVMTPATGGSPGVLAGPEALQPRPRATRPPQPPIRATFRARPTSPRVESTGTAPAPSSPDRRPEAPRPSVVSITADYFGPRASIQWYAVTGATPSEITASVQMNGPRHEWLGGTALATVSRSGSGTYTVSRSGNGCTVAPDGPTVGSYVITLPRWAPAGSVSLKTLTWWNDQLTNAAAHERQHIAIYEAADGRLPAVFASATCASIADDLQAAYWQVRREQCEFDMAEYGAAQGLSLERCVGQ